MMKNTLEEVLKIEAECEAVKKNARHEAKIIKDNASVSGRDRVKQKKRDAAHRASDIIKNANEHADEHKARIKDEANTEYNSLTLVAERNIGKAARLILESVVSSL